jgi:hypothetical protein
MTAIELLQDWFASVSDGDWEHSHSIEISTLDNPGWSVSIPLSETPLEDQAFSPVEIELSEHDWYHCTVEKGIFKGYGGPRNLTNLLSCFLDWANRMQK